MQPVELTLGANNFRLHRYAFSLRKPRRSNSCVARNRFSSSYLVMTNCVRYKTADTSIVARYLMALLEPFFSQPGPGASAAIIKPRHDILFENIGYSDCQTGDEITPRTIFELASVSKVFTATAVMKLVESATTDLGTPINELLPASCGYTSRSDVRPIKLRDLLQHTSGVIDYLQDGMYTDPAKLTPDYVNQMLGDWLNTATPGRSFSYSNTNYYLLSLIIENLCNENYVDHVHRTLFDRHGLSNTSIPNPSESRAAKGYYNLGTGVNEIDSSASIHVSVFGDGGVESNVEDLGRWWGLFCDGQILKRDTVDLMATPGMLDDGTTFNYGLGLQVERLGFDRWFGHNGSWTSSTCVMGQYSGRSDCSIIVLSNELAAPVERISKYLWRTHW